jgi:hypothetical protein
MLSQYFSEDSNENFVYFSKNKIKINAKSLSLQHIFDNINGVIFFTYNSPILDLVEDSDFFYKGSIYDNIIIDLENVFYIFFLENYNFEHIFEYNLLLIKEIYKINILLSLNKLINLYF